MPYMPRTSVRRAVRTMWMETPTSFTLGLVVSRTRTTRNVASLVRRVSTASRVVVVIEALVLRPITTQLIRNLLGTLITVLTATDQAILLISVSVTLTVNSLRRASRGKLMQETYRGRSLRKREVEVHLVMAIMSMSLIMPTQSRLIMNTFILISRTILTCLLTLMLCPHLPCIVL